MIVLNCLKRRWTWIKSNLRSMMPSRWQLFPSWRGEWELDPSAGKSMWNLPGEFPHAWTDQSAGSARWRLTSTPPPPFPLRGHTQQLRSTYDCPCTVLCFAVIHRLRARLYSVNVIVIVPFLCACFEFERGLVEGYAAFWLADIHGCVPDQVQITWLRHTLVLKRMNISNTFLNSTVNLGTN